MNLEHLHQFTVTARELHFGRAAALLGMTQPALSRTVKRLEHDLGVDLFDRTRRQVTLTAAGSAYLDEVTRLLQQSALATERARRTARADRTMHVGYVASTMFQLIPGALRRLRGRVSGASFSFHEHVPAEQFARLREGSLDIALVHEAPPPHDDLRVVPLVRSKFYVALPDNSPLAELDDVSFAELREMPLVDTDAAYSPILREHVLAAYRTAGYEPAQGPPASTLLSTLGLVASGAGVSFTHLLVKELGMKGVAFLPIRDAAGLPDITLGLVTLDRALTNEMESVVAAFVETGAELSLLEDTRHG